MSEQTIPQRSGLAWHVHHTELIGYCYDIEERRAYIRTHKPATEIPARLTRLQFVRRPLGDAILLQAYGQAYEQALQVYEQARQMLQAYEQARLDSIDPAALEEAHREECPGCPWDGTTLFPEAGGAR